MKYYKYHERKYQSLRREGKKRWQVSLIKPFTEFLLFHRLLPKSKVLELGCGTGDISFSFARRGFEVTGVDISPTAIRMAKKRAKEKGLKVKFVVGDVTKLKGFCDNYYDLVLDGHCLHCLVWQEDRQGFLKNSLRVLKPGGYLVVNTMAMPPRKYVDKYRNEFILQKGIQLDKNGRAWIVVGKTQFALPIRYTGFKTALLKEIRNAGFRIRKWIYQKEPEGPEVCRLIVYGENCENCASCENCARLEIFKLL
ncbi:MAG: methyltransferase domain-containing protein [Elusimicrobiota bacterium]